jgi:hypothetical protein
MAAPAGLAREGGAQVVKGGTGPRPGIFPPGWGWRASYLLPGVVCIWNILHYVRKLTIKKLAELLKIFHAYLFIF